MEYYTSCFIQACHQLGYPYHILHSGNNTLKIILPHKDTYIINGHGEWLSDHHREICLDKDIQINIIGSHLFPKTLSACDPYLSSMYQSYASQTSYTEIIQTWEKTFSYPFIIKPNRGAQGINVQIIHNQEQALQAITNIFYQDQRYYDYIALGQEYLNIKKEYRVICLDGTIEMILEKDVSQAQYTGNISPLHWTGATVIWKTDVVLYDIMEKIVSEVFSSLHLTFGGLDIVQTQDNQFYLLEINAHPGFRLFRKVYGDKPLISLYTKLLQRL